MTSDDANDKRESLIPSIMFNSEESIDKIIENTKKLRASLKETLSLKTYQEKYQILDPCFDTQSSNKHNRPLYKKSKDCINGITRNMIVTDEESEVEILDETSSGVMMLSDEEDEYGDDSFIHKSYKDESSNIKRAKYSAGIEDTRAEETIAGNSLKENTNSNSLKENIATNNTIASPEQIQSSTENNI
eukprot:GHVR01188906.1.p1 GENE.GHVR01188906.1~~GHVR01188906.1.p1  ORF type:complete len:189 (+),score=30.14 GHVR01188906.1:152-718(+)